jgi:hypothetical protein
MHFSILVITSVFVPLARGAALQSRALSGEATFYGGNLQGGTCSFSTYTLPSGVYGTALSDSNWDNAGNCGACISVTGPAGNSITAMVGSHHFSRGLLLNLLPDRRSMPRLRPQSSRPVRRCVCRIGKPLYGRNPDDLVIHRLSNHISPTAAQQRRRVSLLVQHASSQCQQGRHEPGSKYQRRIDLGWDCKTTIQFLPVLQRLWDHNC